MGAKSLIKILFKELLDLIYKRKCVNCGCAITSDILCKNCAKTVQNLPFYPQGKINGYPVYSCFYYQGAIKKLIHALKFHHNKSCAYFAALYLKDYIQNLTENGLVLNNPIIIPVLTHKKNYNKRGYDNVFLIAAELSDLTGFKLNSRVLLKTKWTRAQYELSAKERRENVKGSFKLDENFKPENTLILLDDITTTGSTLEYLTSLFKKNQIKDLICLTLAKTK